MVRLDTFLPWIIASFGIRYHSLNFNYNGSSIVYVYLFTHGRMYTFGGWCWYLSRSRIWVRIRQFDDDERMALYQFRFIITACHHILQRHLLGFALLCMCLYCSNKIHIFVFTSESLYCFLMLLLHIILFSMPYSLLLLLLLLLLLSFMCVRFTHYKLNAMCISVFIASLKYRIQSRETHSIGNNWTWIAINLRWSSNWGNGLFFLLFLHTFLSASMGFLVYFVETSSSIAIRSVFLSIDLFRSTFKATYS